MVKMQILVPYPKIKCAFNSSGVNDSVLLTGVQVVLTQIDQTTDHSGETLV